MKRLDELLTGQHLPDPRFSTATGAGSAGTDPEALEPGVCPKCRGGGFVRRAVPMGHPDFGKAVPCDCLQSESPDDRQSRLERYSSLGPLTRLTFANLMPQGRSTNPRDRDLFRSLVTEDLKKIVDIELRKVVKRLKEKGLTLTVTDEAKDLLIEKGTSLDYGARPLRRAIDHGREHRVDGGVVVVAPGAIGID